MYGIRRSERAECRRELPEPLTHPIAEMPSVTAPGLRVALHEFEGGEVFERSMHGPCRIADLVRDVARNRGNTLVSCERVEDPSAERRDPVERDFAHEGPDLVTDKADGLQPPCELGQGAVEASADFGPGHELDVSRVMGIAFDRAAGSGGEVGERPEVSTRINGGQCAGQFNRCHEVFDGIRERVAHNDESACSGATLDHSSTPSRLASLLGWVVAARLSARHTRPGPVMIQLIRWPRGGATSPARGRVRCCTSNPTSCP